jgi:quinol monooxygenase YgiN
MNENISLYSNWWLKPECIEIAKPILQALAEEVKAHEPDTLMYLVNFSRYDFPNTEIVSEPKTRPGAITFMEKYRSWKAFEDHLYGPIFTKFVADYGHLFVQAEPAHGEKSKPFTQVVFLDELAGFRREDNLY